MTRAALLLGTALTGLPGSAFGQTQLASAEAADQTITVTATRSPTDVQSVPVTVTVIDEQRIADELATDVRDLVRFEPGVIVPRSPARFSAALGATGRDGNSGFRIRGIGGNRVLIQVDGIRVPDGFSFGAQLAGPRRLCRSRHRPLGRDPARARLGALRLGRPRRRGQLHHQRSGRSAGPRPQLRCARARHL